MATASKQFELKGLREKRSGLRVQIEAIGTAMRSEGRAMKPEERETFNRLNAEVTALGDQIRSAEADLKTISDIVSADDGDSGAGDVGRANVDKRAEVSTEAAAIQRAEDVRVARQAWCRAQYGIPLKRNHVEACKRLKFNPKARTLEVKLGNPKSRSERLKRALTVTTTGGGYLIAEDYSFQLEQKLVSFSGTRGVLDEFQTENGADLPYPTEDDTGNTGELLAINTAVAEADPTFASVTFLAFKFSSKAILVPMELMQDAAFDVESLVFGECGTRIGRIQGTYFTTGTGSSQPHGVVTASALGTTTAAATAFTSDELFRLTLAVDPAYKVNDACSYMMKEDVLGYCMLLKDATGRPLLRESFRDGMTVPMIHGYRVNVNQNMTGLTSNAPVTATKHVLFGDYTKHKIRDAGAMRLRRLDERYAEKDQVGFIGFLRSDARCVNTAAIKHMLQA